MATNTDKRNFLLCITFNQVKNTFLNNAKWLGVESITHIMQSPMYTSNRVQLQRHQQLSNLAIHQRRS
jgi:hypothetical protein